MITGAVLNAAACSGGTSGVGLVVAKSLIQRGANVIITSRSADRGEAAAHSMQQASQDIADCGKVRCPLSRRLLAYIAAQARFQCTTSPLMCT